MSQRQIITQSEIERFENQNTIFSLGRKKGLIITSFVFLCMCVVEGRKEGRGGRGGGAT